MSRPKVSKESGHGALTCFQKMGEVHPNHIRTDHKETGDGKLQDASLPIAHSGFPTAKTELGSCHHILLIFVCSS